MKKILELNNMSDALLTLETELYQPIYLGVVIGHHPNALNLLDRRAINMQVCNIQIIASLEIHYHHRRVTILNATWHVHKRNQECVVEVGEIVFMKLVLRNLQRIQTAKTLTELDTSSTGRMEKPLMLLVARMKKEELL
jgi:hypothetical protein